MRLSLLRWFLIVALLTDLSTNALGQLKCGPWKPLSGGQSVQICQILGSQDVTLDALPVAVIYQPPGSQGSQKLAVTNTYQTKMTMTSAHSHDVGFTAGIDYAVKSGGGAGGAAGYNETKSYSSQTMTWTITALQTTYTASGGPPAEGDSLIFFLRPKFHLTIDYGTLMRYQDGTDKQTLSPSPKIVQSEPILEPPSSSNPQTGTWVLARYEASYLQTSAGANAVGGADVASRLLATDPYFALSHGSRPLPIPTLGQEPENILARVQSNPARFGNAPVDGPDQWNDGCSPLASIQLTQTVGESQTHTYSHTSKVVCRGT